MRGRSPGFFRALCLTALITALNVPAAAGQSAKAIRRYGGFPVQGSGLKILKRELATDRALLQTHRTHCNRARKLMAKAPFCDADRDGLSNQLEKRLGTHRRNKDTDGDGLSDRYELTKSHTHPFNKDSDGDGKADGEEIAAGSDPLKPDAAPTTAPCIANFDENGDTGAFGIPAPAAGNITRGSSAFAERCGTCHRTDKGTNLAFPALKDAIAGRPMFITALDEATLADLVAYLNRSDTGTNAACPTPSVPTAAPEETPAVEPTPALPPAACANQYFDEAGNTTQFEIPAALVGNIGRGGSLLGNRCSGCHSELGRGFTYNQLKAAVTGPLMNIPSLSDPQFADLAAWANRALAGAGCSVTPSPAEPTGTATPLPTSTPSSIPCSNQYFDAGGNTQQFGIPTPLTGNIGRGTSFLASRCAGCHGALGTGFTYGQMKAAVTGPLMKITSVTDPQFADLTAWANRALAADGCTTPVATATAVAQPTATSPAPIPTPTPTPYVSSCSNQYFDANGNTQQFGIPSPLSGNLTQGAAFYSLACMSCHGELGNNLTFAQLKSAVTGPKMSIQTVTDQQYAHLVAYLNRSSAPQNCGTPTPVPTPVDDISAGRIMYDVSCRSCHSRPQEFRETSVNELREAIADKRQMRSIVLNDTQLRQVIAYLNSL